MNDAGKPVNPVRDDHLLTQDRRRLRYHRITAGLNLREAGQRAGCDWSLIGKLEKGTRSAGPHTLAKLAAAYGCEISDLMPPQDDAERDAEPEAA